LFLIYCSFQRLTMDSMPCSACCNDNVALGKVDQLLKQSNMPYNHTYVIDNVFNIVPELCGMLLPDSSHSSNVELIIELIQILPEICPPKELYVALLEQMDTFKDDLIYFVLLLPLGKCIQKLPSKKHQSLAMALETLTAHIMTLPTPAEPTECVLTLPSGLDAVEQRLAKSVGALLDFVAPFVDDVLRLNSSKRCQTSAVRHVFDITRCVLQLLGEPLSSVNLCESVEEGSNVKSPCRECAERCLSLLVQLHPDVIKLIVDASDHKETIERQQRRSQLASGDLLADETEELCNVEQPLSTIGLAVMLYLVHGEKIFTESIPQVYQHCYLLELNLHLVQLLLTGHTVAAVHKGIILGLSLFTNVGTKSLDASVLEHEKMFGVLEAVVAVMTSSRVKEVSQSAIQLLHTILKSFSAAGRSRLLEFLLVSCANKNAHGHAISLLKDEIDEALNSRDVSPPSFLAGNSLKHLLLKVFEAVPGGYRSNLLTSLSDLVMAALNLLRYLVIRDSYSQNSTGIWDLLATIEEQFLQPLRVGIVFCRSDINAEMQKLSTSEQNNQHSRDGADAVVEYNIGDESVPDLTVDQQKEAMNSALISLDMMESVRCRVQQLIDSAQ